jgi:hypothetical protein
LISGDSRDFFFFCFGGEAYKIPKLKIARRASFVFVCIWRWRIAGMGRRRRAQLRKMLLPAYVNQTCSLFKQWPGREGWKDLAMGVQIRRFVKKDQMKVAMMSPMVHHRAMFVFPPVKMRRYWRATESLEQVREVPYMNVLT